MSERFDIAVVGGGAAGLMAAIFAGRSGARVVVLDGAPKIGAKIVISGGGRCNVTHDVVRAEDFNGSRNAIAKVLRTFTVSQTIDFFRELGLALKREETGKLFPTTDKAKTVVDALLRAAEVAEIRTGHRVTAIAKDREGFALTILPGAEASAPDSKATDDTAEPHDPSERGRVTLTAKHVVIATGGRSVPKTGSDGAGYAFARVLGHTVTPTFPALVPLILPERHWLTTLSGTSVEAQLAVRGGSGRVLHREHGSMLFTHHGISGPAVLDISRHWLAARNDDPAAALTANLIPGTTFEALDAQLVGEARRNGRATVSSLLRAMIPERLVAAVASSCGIEPQMVLGRLSRDARRRLVASLVELPLPVVRDRGFDYAEVTAGGVPLSELELTTMESRVCPGLYLCGEILDVDGKIGGYNFQWAWSSGRLAGLGAASALRSG